VAGLLFVAIQVVHPSDTLASVTTSAGAIVHDVSMVMALVASEGLFRFAIAAFVVVTFLDILMAWALYLLLRPVNAALAMLVGWLRLASAAAFLPALANLLTRNALGPNDAMVWSEGAARS
jgi:hypothetical protein